MTKRMSKDFKTIRLIQKADLNLKHWH